jgi:hypothetical protein
MCFWNRELLAQTEARMMHFVTLTVPHPRTDHSLMHNTLQEDPTVDKLISLPCVKEKRMANTCRSSHKFVVRGQKKRTANKSYTVCFSFVVRPIKNARQTSSCREPEIKRTANIRMAKSQFPVVITVATSMFNYCTIYMKAFDFSIIIGCRNLKLHIRIEISYIIPCN